MAHRRLSVVDLSALARQPMTSKDGRWVIVFNGEIYNYTELREQFDAKFGPAQWQGHSDTRVLIEWIAREGVVSAVQRANGMFALAVFDRRDRMLWLARDRLGEKPLYYGQFSGRFLFASELKGLTAFPGFPRTIAADVIPTYLRYGYIGGSRSIYRDVSKLEPGCVLQVSTAHSTVRVEVQKFWQVPNPEPDKSIRPDDATGELSRLLTESVRLRMEADVPLGAFLSGGVDSSLVTAIMQSVSTRKVRTFSIGFESAERDEAPHARRIAQHLGTDHTEMYVSDREVLESIPRLPVIYDEPFADSSQIPTAVLSALTRKHVTVALSGDGGDELFAGYDRYRWMHDLSPVFGAVPHSLRRFIGECIAGLAPSTVQAGVRLLTSRHAEVTKGDRLGRIARIVASRNKFEAYRTLMSVNSAPATFVRGLEEPLTLLDDPAVQRGIGDFRDWMMHVDLRTYLPDDILVKVDRATMAASLEVRVPMLDHRIVEFAAKLPVEIKMRNGEAKWPLKSILDGYVPRALFARPKSGFGVPLSEWLRGPLRPWVNELLSSVNPVSDAYLDMNVVRSTWAELIAGKNVATQGLWSVLMLKSWALVARPEV